MFTHSFRKLVFMTLAVWLFSEACRSQTLFYQSFDTAWTVTSSLPGWGGTSSPGNNTWHKNSYTTGWTSSSSGAYTPGGAAGTSGSARFHSCGAGSGTYGSVITPSINCSASADNKKLSFYYINGSAGSDELNVYLSYDGGASWSSSVLRLRYSSGWIRYTVPLGRTTVTALKVRFEGDQGGAAGSSDIGIDEVLVSAYSQPYSGLPYTQDFESAWLNHNGTRDVPDLYWQNCPETRDASWRRQDDGSSASWGNSSNGIVSPAYGSYSANFHSYNARSGHFGYMDLHLDLSEAGIKQLSFNYHNASAGDRLDISLSTNGGQTFSAPLASLSAGDWSGQVVDVGSSTSRYAVIRFLGTSDEGFDDIGIDNVDVQVLDPLSLTFLYFRVTWLQGKVLLEWATDGTAQDLIPEKSIDGRSFTAIESAKVLPGEKVHRVYDEAGKGLYYYRITCIKASGEKEYSQIIPLKDPWPGGIAFTYSASGLQACFNDLSSSDLFLIVYDLYGNVVRRASVVTPCISLPMDDLAPGLYLVKACGGNTCRIEKWIVSP